RAAMAAGVATARVGRAHAADAQQCSDSQYPASRDSSNPLMLRTPPGPNPLHGARFFVDGPRHGSAAGAIAQLLGIDPTRYSDAYSWKRFKRNLEHGPLHRKLAGPGKGLLRYKVHLCEKVADQPEPQRTSAFSGGGG